VRLTFDELDPRILPDMGVKVAFQETIDEDTEAVQPQSVIPQAAVRNREGKTVVCVVQDGVIERRAVRVGRAAASDVDVLAGIIPGETVVVNGPEDLADGDRVRTRK